MRLPHLVLLGLLVSSACASTEIENSWRSPTAPAGTLTNVVTMAEGAKSPSIRRSSEDQLAAQLQKRGVHAVPAYAVLPDDAINDRDKMISLLEAKGFDGLVSMRFMGADQKLVSYPSLYDYWGPGWGYGYYYGGYDVYTETIVRVSISAYSLPTHNLVWSAVSRTVDPDNLNDLINETTAVAAKGLEKQQVVAQPTQTAQR